MDDNKKEAGMGDRQLSISDVIEEAHRNAVDKGWYDPPPSIPDRLCLIHSEVSEALEDYRNGRMGLRHADVGCEALREEDTLYKPVGFPSELADIIIRVADLAGFLGIDLEEAIKDKMAYNRTRPHRHGGKAC